MAAAGCVMALNTVWLISDTANALMAFPNLVALVLLAPMVGQATKDYFSRNR